MRSPPPRTLPVEVVPATAAEKPGVPETEKPPKRRSFPAWLRYGALGTAVLILIGLTVGLVEWIQRPALDDLWHPLLRPQQAVLFCVPSDAVLKRDGMGNLLDPASSASNGKLKADSTFWDREALEENVVYSDMLATLHIASLLTARHFDYRTKLTDETSLEDLRQGPTVLIGGLDNQWTMRSLAPLRFHFAGSDDAGYWIMDRNDPNNQTRMLNLKVRLSLVTRDYAIVARLHNEQTGQPQMIVAGIGMSATAAAGEFLTSEAQAEQLKRRIGAGFRDRDFEVVLRTDVVNGVGGTAKILAVAVW